MPIRAPYAEIIRQWSSLHPEFSFLPRKFKIAVIAAEHDRAAMQLHDIGLHLKRLADGGLGFAVYVGGGMGRTPFIAKKIRDDLPEEDLLSYLEAILRVYNLQGRRDNKYKARIKILVHEIGAAAFSAQVEEELQRIRDGALKLPEAEIERIAAYFAPPAFDERARQGRAQRHPIRAFDRWVTRNTHTHKQPGYAIVTISLKPIGGIPGDASADQMDAVADLAERYSFDEVRVTHEQNLVLPHVRIERPACRLRRRSRPSGSPRPTPASSPTSSPAPASTTARSPTRARSPSPSASPSGWPQRQDQIGDLKIKISGCINACGHHHVGHIGILGVEKRGEEHYQLLLGGSGAEDASLGRDHRPGLRSGRHRRCGRDGRRHLPEAAHEPRGALPRRLPPPRRRPLQGGALCRRLTC